ncbi:unnamed protein product [Camellia sinensis]
MSLAQAKKKKWKAWEQETNSLEYQFNNDPARFRFAHQTSFVRQHSGFSTMPGLRWVVAFFRQFFASVTKVDYLTMRHRFINVSKISKLHTFYPIIIFLYKIHNKNDSSYICKILMTSTKYRIILYNLHALTNYHDVPCGSVPLWIFAVIFQLLNVYSRPLLSLSLSLSLIFSLLLFPLSQNNSHF